MRFEDTYKIRRNVDQFRGSEMRFNEEYRVPKQITGHVWATLRHIDGSEEKFDFGNLVINDASILVARLLSDKNDPVWGIKFLAVGSGDATWPDPPPSPTGAEHGLISEIARKTFSSVNFIDGSGAVTTTPTNVVDYVTIFNQGEAGPAALREMGLVGGDAISTPVAFANGGKNTDVFFNLRRFSVINVPATGTLTLVWRITT